MPPARWRISRSARAGPPPAEARHILHIPWPALITAREAETRPFTPPARLPSIAVVIPSRDAPRLIRTVLAGLDATDYPDLSVVVADNGSTDPETLAEYARRPALRVLMAPGPFDFAAQVNRAVAATRSEAVLLLNNDVEVIAPGWLREMGRLSGPARGRDRRGAPRLSRRAAPACRHDPRPRRRARGALVRRRPAGQRGPGRPAAPSRRLLGGHGRLHAGLPPVLGGGGRDGCRTVPCGLQRCRFLPARRGQGLRHPVDALRHADPSREGHPAAARGRPTAPPSRPSRRRCVPATAPTASRIPPSAPG
ncbi:MAG: hypothetical protein KatS3mg118_0269 [Paracoccaceae bacterium]|nr:MAG: hypothetical protein KatS3mg118_0269 [Paracoccaceae bacterium]